MIKISFKVFSLTLLFLICFFYSISTKYFDTEIKNSLLQITTYNIIISTLFLLVFSHKIDLLSFSLFLGLLCIVLYLFTSKQKFKFFLFLLKSYYIFLVCFIATFSFYEILSHENIYLLADSNYKLFILILISLILYFMCETLFYNNLNSEKLHYILSSINILVLISMFVLLIGKNYSLFYILNFSRHSFLISVMFLASTLLEIYFVFFVIIAISKSYNLSIYKHKNKILNMQYDLQMSNLKQLEEYQSDIRKISHDLHNHKVILHNLIIEKDYEKALQYLEFSSYSFNENKYELLTNHKIINALLLNKKNICLKENINLDFDVNLPDTICVSDFDLCIIIGNLMDNSIDACRKLSLNTPKYIKFKGKIINSNLVFEIKNNFNGKLNIKNHKLLTLKNDTLNHGLGLSNVGSTVNKYLGSYDFSYSDDEFISLIIIPLN